MVARHPSLTAAADALGLTHGALSRRVAAMEAWLGTSLFERHGRGMRLTTDGQRFLSRIDEAFAMIEAAADPWRGRRGPDVVRLSVVPSLARFWLLERLSGLERGTDGGMPLRIDVAIEHRNADVEAGEVDVAIRYGRGRWRGVEARPLMTERLVPVAPASLAERLGPEVSVSAIMRHPLIYDSDATGWRAWLDGAGPSRFRPRPHDRRFEDYGLVLAAAEAGLGIPLARLPFAQAAIDAAGLMRLSTREVANPLRYHVLTRLGEVRPAVLALVSRLERAAHLS